MSGLFISYRRDDTAPYAGRIYDFLRRAFPESKVFMDIDTIEPGEDFVEAINQTLAASKIVVAYVLGVLAALYALSRVKQDEAGALLILCVPFFGFSAWFNVMLVRGKNWARMAYIAMFMLSFPAVFRGIQEQSATEMAIYVALLILSLWLMRLMFSEPIRHLYIHNR